MRNVGGSNPPSSTFFFPRNVTSHLSTAVIYKSYPLIFFCARWTSLLLRTYSSHTHIPWYLPGTIVPGYSSYSSTSELRTVHQHHVQQYISTTYSNTSVPRTWYSRTGTDISTAYNVLLTIKRLHIKQRTLLWYLLHTKQNQGGGVLECIPYYILQLLL